MYSKQLFSKCKLFFSFFLDGVGTGGKLSLPILIIYFFSIGKFPQRPNMTKVELISDVQTFLDYLTSDEINVLDANFVSDQVIEIHYENNENFVTPNSKTPLLQPPMHDSSSTECWTNCKKECCTTIRTL
jgi:hypothetical protein